MSQPLRIHYHSSSYSSTHNNSSYSYYVQSSSFPSSSSSSSLSLTSSTSPSSPISISFTPLYSPLTALPQQHHELGDSPISIQLTPISSDDQFDQVLAHTHHDQHPLIIVWMANWCRKCIYLKPKLEKLAAEYYPRLRFYTVDVNTVSHKLVARAGVTKMPTIQLWKDGKKQAEVIGGHNAYWVIGDVQEMIENECNM